MEVYSQEISDTYYDWALLKVLDPEWDMPFRESHYRYLKAERELFRTTDVEKAVTDVELFEIHYDAVKKLLDLQDPVHASHIRRYLAFFDDFADGWCKFVHTNIASYDIMVDSLKDSLYYRVIYIYRNSLLLSSAVSLHFGSVLRENQSLIRRLLQKNTLNICSLGGGSASDIVAIVAVLQSIAKRKKRFLDIRVTIVDMDVRWKNTCLAVLGCMEQFRRAMWKINFVHADVSEMNLAHEVTKAVKNADIVTMVKFLSEFNGSQLNLRKTIKNVTRIISPGSLLFVLDSAEIEVNKACGGHTGELDSYQLIYEEICYLHTLELAAVEKIILTYQKHLAALQCNTNLSVFVRIWQKSADSRMNKISESELQQRLQRNLDQYNLKETFLDKRFYHSWKERFSKEMSKMGWSQRGIAKILAEKEMCRTNLKMFLTEIKLLMDLDIEDLEYVSGLNGSRKIVEMFDEEDWESYLEDKTDFAVLKQQTYRLSVLSLYNHLTRIKTCEWN